MISLVLAITFLLSVPAFAYGTEKEAPSISSVQQENDRVNKFNIYTNLLGATPKENDFEIKASKIKHNSAVLKWSSKKLYISYTVQKLNPITNNWDEYKAVTKTRIKLKSLAPSTEYHFAIASTASGEILGTIDFTTPAKPKPQYKLVEMPLPNVSGSCKTFAYYKAVTNRKSPAYAVLNSGTANGKTYKTYTDKETGIRMVDDCYCAALGTFYGTEKGVKYKITLSTGKSFKIILCDSKANRHTDSNNQYAVNNKDIVEFYVEKPSIPARVRGNYNVLEQFNGDIVKIEKMVKI